MWFIDEILCFLLSGCHLCSWKSFPWSCSWNWWRAIWYHLQQWCVFRAQSWWGSCCSVQKGALISICCKLYLRCVVPKDVWLSCVVYPTFNIIYNLQICTVLDFINAHITNVTCYFSLCLVWWRTQRFESRRRLDGWESEEFHFCQPASSCHRIHPGGLYCYDRGPTDTGKPGEIGLVFQSMNFIQIPVENGVANKEK